MVSLSASHHRLRSALAVAFLVLVLLVLAVLHWGGFWLVKSEALPAHADGAVILQGSLTSENARIAGAVQLLKRGIVDQLLLSIPARGYWGSSVPDIARTYLEKQYGTEIAGRIAFCETGPDVDSTEQESLAILPCIQQQHWRSFVVVTSNFHSRRASIVWHHTWRTQPPIHLYVDGVADPSFQPKGWWHHRLYAKTWFLESTKLLWTLF